MRDVDDATTAVAAQLLSLACACEGEDALAHDLSDAGYEMCKRLGLFSAPAAQSAPVAVGGHSARSRRWRAHIAWGVYNWLRQVPYHHEHETALTQWLIVRSLHAFHYRQPPVASPPELPVPGDGHGDVDEALTDPSSPFMVSTITSLCKFWRILHPIVERYVPEGDQPSQGSTLATAEDILQKLLLWADGNLTECNESGNLNQPHHVLVMQ